MQIVLLDNTKKKSSVLIPILTNNDTNKYNQYLLTQNVFDPAKNSPPNEFMIKLHMRMASYQKMNTESR